MKKILFLISLTLGFTFLISCNDTKTTYAEDLKAEQTLIKDFIARNNIEVVTVMPTSYPWPNNVYYKSSTGLYFHLTSRGDTTFAAVKTNDLVLCRFIQYTLGVNADTVRNTNTIEFPFPTEFHFKNYSQVCSGWHEAVDYMKYDGSECKIIVPSQIGFQTDANSVIPKGYDLKITLQ